MEHIDYDEVTELLAKYNQKLTPSLSVAEKDLLAEMTTKLSDLNQLSREVVDLVLRLDALALHPLDPIPDGEGYDIINFHGHILRMKRADPKIPIKRENSMVGYVRGGPPDPFRTPEIRELEGKLERATFAFYQIAHRITHVTEKLPRLLPFKSPSVRIVRNHLLEHPEGKASGVTYDTFSYSKNDGPCVKGVRRGEQMQHRDEGFRKNSEEFVRNLKRTLLDALA
jgi:hypothetical protein